MLTLWDECIGLTMIGIVDQYIYRTKSCLGAITSRMMRAFSRAAASDDATLPGFSVCHRCAEIVPAVDDEIGALAQPEQRLRQIGEHLEGLCVGRAFRQKEQVMLEPHQKAQDLLGMLDPFERIAGFRERL